tara:strand:+ start:44588 stop:45511 length:924 start_codon:yes stop_codon:yes gene_type:complete
MNYRYERLSDNRIADVQYLFKEVFKKNVSSEYLLKKYATDYVGVKHMCFLAYHDSMPVAFYGAIPQLFNYDQQLFKVAHACDSITLPSHHRKGLHTNLAIRSYELMRENNIKFVYAMHSENTMRATKKLGWKVGESMIRYHIKILTVPIAKVTSRLGFLDSAYQRKVKRILSRFEIQASLLNPLHNENWLCHAYSSSFFDYKNFSPNYLIEIKGVKMWLKVQSIIHVGAFHAESTLDLKVALKDLVQVGKKIGANEIQFHVSENTAQNSQLNQLHSGLNSWTVGYLDLGSSMPLDKLKLNYGDHDTF